MTVASDWRFLIVDDCATLRGIVRGLLAQLGHHHVTEAADGLLALQMLRTARCDFVVSDINMPNLNGFELLQAIQADQRLRHLPVLMVMAEARAEDIALAAQSGAAGYIVKPFTKAALQAKVHKLLHRSAATA